MERVLICLGPNLLLGSVVVTEVKPLIDLKTEHPILVEGLPGLGLVGAIAVEQMLSQIHMKHYANIISDRVPKLSVFEEREVKHPLRIYVDEEKELFVLVADEPIPISVLPEFSKAIVEWWKNVSEDGQMVLISGVPTEGEERHLYGIATDGLGTERLEQAGIQAPEGTGIVTGATGAILDECLLQGVPAIGLITESDIEFPDPSAALILIKRGLNPILDLDIKTEILQEQAEFIREQKKRLVERIHRGEEEAAAGPGRMYE